MTVPFADVASWRAALDSLRVAVADPRFADGPYRRHAEVEATAMARWTRDGREPCVAERRALSLHHTLGRARDEGLAPGPDGWDAVLDDAIAVGWAFRGWPPGNPGAASFVEVLRPTRRAPREVQRAHALAIAAALPVEVPPALAELVARVRDGLLPLLHDGALVTSRWTAIGLALATDARTEPLLDALVALDESFLRPG